MSTKTKRLQKYLLTKLMTLEGNLQQWAMVDSHLGEEKMLRLNQALALNQGDTTAATAIHDKRIACLEKALEILRACPACGPGDDPKAAREMHDRNLRVVERREEAACDTPGGGAGSGEPGAAAGGKPPTT